jgi:hypothetical protein
LEDEGFVLPRGTTTIRRIAHAGDLSRSGSVLFYCALMKPPRANGREPRKTTTSRFRAFRRLAQGCHPVLATTALAACAPLSKR